MKLKGKTSTQECIVIPVKTAHLYEGEKGIYLDLTAIEPKQPSFGQSHFIKQNLPEAVYKALTKEEQDALPIIGNVMTFAPRTMQAADDLPEGGQIEGDLPF